MKASDSGEISKRIDEAIVERWSLLDDIKHPRLDEYNHPKCAVIWSASDYADAPGLTLVDILDDIAVPGKVRFVEMHDLDWPNWGAGATYFSPVVEDPTWLDVAVLANDMIHTSGDFHHVFLEGINEIGHDADGTQIYQFAMGS